MYGTKFKVLFNQTLSDFESQNDGNSAKQCGEVVDVYIDFFSPLPDHFFVPFLIIRINFGTSKFEKFISLEPAFSDYEKKDIIIDQIRDPFYVRTTHQTSELTPVRPLSSYRVRRLINWEVLVSMV